MTPAIAAVLAAGCAVLAVLLLVPWWRWRRRRRLLSTPLEPALRAALGRHVRTARLLPAALAARLEGLVHAFLAEKNFVGCNGLEVTDEIRAAVAGHACLLLLGRPGSLYDELRSILVYPSAFWVEDEVEDDAGLVTRRRRELSGEAWDSHRIILAWDDIAATAAGPPDGYNVVLHECAHYLDAEGRGLAAPRPRDAARGPRSLESWHADLTAAYDTFVDAVEHGETTFLDPYGAEDEAEFFAVATEEFIERPRELRAAVATLYALLREYYGIDPAAWHDASAAGMPAARG